MYDAVVVGGGIVGASAAYHLVCGGAKTLLIDRADAGRATDAGAGIITAGTGGPGIADPWFVLALEAERYYPVLVEQLSAAQASDTGYAACGLLRVAVSDDEVEAFEYVKQRLVEREARWGASLSEEVAEISAGEARRLFPPLGHAQRAMYFRKAARVDGRLMSAALMRAATARGLEVRRGSVERLVASPPPGPRPDSRGVGEIRAVARDGVTGVVVDGETISSERVIIAGGAWSRAFGEQIGVEIPVEPLRGQIIHLGLAGMDTANWPIVEPFRSHYMVCWPDSRVVCGATWEQAGFDPRITAAGVFELLSEALRVAPGLAKADIREIRVGLRPYTADHLPVLGSVPGVAGVYLATGMGATGLHLGPYCGKLAAGWALGQQSGVDISAFGVGRFIQ
jgi:D-amino-acid dehydrogenase